MKIIGLVQAHCRSWGGARDFPLAQVHGKYAEEDVIDRLPSVPQNSHGELPVAPWHVREYSFSELRAILSPHFHKVKILSSKSGGRLTESETGQKMVALCQ